GQRNYATEFHNALALFEAVAARFSGVQIDNRDFEPFVKLYQSPRTLFYCDPPYIGSEHYYGGGEDAQAFHERLARQLNATSALVALPYPPSALLNVLHPPPKWRRIVWTRPTH